MNIICIDSDPGVLRSLLRQTRRLMPEAAVHGCRDPDEAVALAEREGCDVLLTDANLERTHTDGFMLAEKIKTLNPRVNIIFATERLENQYACAAYRLHASGYITKPYDADALAEEFQNLRYAVV